MNCVKGDAHSLVYGRHGLQLTPNSEIVYLPYCSMLLVPRCVQCFQPFPDGVFFEVHMLEETCQRQQLAAIMCYLDQLLYCSTRDGSIASMTFTLCLRLVVPAVVSGSMIDHL